MTEFIYEQVDVIAILLQWSLLRMHCCEEDFIKAYKDISRYVPKSKYWRLAEVDDGETRNLRKA